LTDDVSCKSDGGSSLTDDVSCKSDDRS
jgi:hypothetical protein